MQLSCRLRLSFFRREKWFLATLGLFKSRFPGCSWWRSLDQTQQLSEGRDNFRALGRRAFLGTRWTRIKHRHKQSAATDGSRRTEGDDSTNTQNRRQIQTDVSGEWNPDGGLRRREDETSREPIGRRGKSGKDEKKVTNDRMNKDKVKARRRIKCNKREDKRGPPATAGTETWWNIVDCWNTTGGVGKMGPKKMFVTS